jgi:sarcosine oxidase
LPEHDVIVVGLGAHGSATLYQLAKRGISAIGIDRFNPPHEMGSTHGETRGTYEAGALGSAHHVPFSRRTIELWRELERDSGIELLTQDGILIMAGEDSELFRSTLKASTDTGSQFEVLDAGAIHARFPTLVPEDDVVAVYQPKGGVMRVEPTIGLQLQLALQHGATIRANEPVVGWTASESGVEVVTTQDTYRGGKVIFALGAYLPELVDLPVPITAERQLFAWWKPRTHADNFALGRVPVWMLEKPTHEIIYAFPDIGTGVKTGTHFEGTVTDPETVDRSVTDADLETLRTLLATIQPDVMGEYLRGVVCLYTCTPDRDFIVDVHPNHSNVIVACICNGQGFKYSAAFGETLAQLAIEGRTDLDISPWSLARFASS